MTAGRGFAVLRVMVILTQHRCVRSSNQPYVAGSMFPPPLSILTVWAEEIIAISYQVPVKTGMLNFCSKMKIISIALAKARPQIIPIARRNGACVADPSTHISPPEDTKSFRNYLLLSFGMKKP